MWKHATEDSKRRRGLLIELLESCTGKPLEILGELE